jgi:SAM-dependent methyltransferase
VAANEGSSSDGWADDDNARHYDSYARQYPMYRQTSRTLVALARLSGSSVVLDLACGTGITAEAVLAALGPEGRVIGVDKSAAMLGIAAAAIADPRVTWIRALAENVDQYLHGQADAVVCNSAIWQTDFAATSAAVGSVLAAGGRFAFNWPSGFLDQGEDSGPSDDQLSLTSVMRAVAAEEYGWTLPDSGPPVRSRPRLSRESICRCLSDAGFEVELVEELTYEDSAESRRAWLSVPIFTQHNLPGLPYQDRLRVLDKAYERLGPAEDVAERWLAFAAIAT